ncbi:MAG: DUF494 domain-containing protein [Ignavibacteria bacterium]|nr:DUF494 domain-containing protein [Ignavibacteria bacterium]
MNNTYSVERVMDIITDMISERKSGTPLAALDTDQLQQRGYSEAEIAAALSWIMEQGVQLTESGSDGFRILHGIEQNVLTTEAWGMLMTYADLGFLAPDDVEQILERAVMMGSERLVGIPEIKAIIAAYMLDGSVYANSSNRRLLLGSDSVH